MLKQKTESDFYACLYACLKWIFKSIKQKLEAFHLFFSPGAPPMLFMDLDVDNKAHLSGVADVKVIKISEGFNSKLTRPMLWRGNYTRRQEIRQRQTLTFPDGYCYQLNNALVIGLGGVATANNELLTGRLLHLYKIFEEKRILGFQFHQNGSSYTLERKLREKKLPGSYILLARRGGQSYGHWLVDIVPRIAGLGRAIRFTDKFIFYSPVPPYARFLLKAIGISETQVIEFNWNFEALRVDELFVPEFVRLYDHFLPSTVGVWDKIKAYALANAGLGWGESVTPTKIYVSRGKLHKDQRCLLNRAEVEHYFISRGFVVIHPELFSVPQQVLLFAQAEVVAGEYGSGLHNTVFSSEGTLVLVIQPADVAPFLQSGIATVKNQKIGYIFGSKSNSSGEYQVDFSVLKAAVDAGLDGCFDDE